MKEGVMVLRVDVAYRWIYTCVDCGTTAEGGVSRVSEASFEAAQNAMRPKPHAMPVGWASYGVLVYRCPRHKK